MKGIELRERTTGQIDASKRNKSETKEMKEKNEMERTATRLEPMRTIPAMEHARRVGREQVSWETSVDLIVR